MSIENNASPDLNQVLVEDYLESVAGKSSTPGGGSVAAITGAQAAALMSMVCHYSKQSNEIQAILESATKAREVFLTLAQEDVLAFDALMKALDQAKGSKDRAKNIQSAMMMAAAPPLKMLTLCASMVDSIITLETHGNTNLLTDLGMAAILLSSCASSAELNVLINLVRIEDEEYKQQVNSNISKFMRTISSIENVAPNIRKSLLSRK